MVLVAGLDRLEGTKVGPWLTDAEWQDHTREVRERFEARSDTSVAFHATAAIQDLNGTELDGRRLYVRAYFT